MVYDTTTALPNQTLAKQESCSFEDFVVAYREQAVRMAYRLTGGSQAAAEDVAQEAFAKAFTSFDGFRGESAMNTWFFRILTRKAANYRRWRGIKRKWEAIWHAQRETSSHDVLVEPAIRGAIAHAMDVLSERQREVFTLIYLEGISMKEVCLILGCAEGTARTHLHRANQVLRSELKEIWGELNEV